MECKSWSIATAKCLYDNSKPQIGKLFNQIAPIRPCNFITSNNNAYMASSPIDVSKAISGKNNEDIAEDLGVSPGYVSRLNRRERNLTLTHIELLAKSAGIPLADFFIRLGEALKTEENAPEAKPSRGSRRAELAKALTFDQSEKVNFDPTAFKRAYRLVLGIHKSVLGGIGDDDDFTRMFLEAYETIVSEQQNQPHRS